MAALFVSTRPPTMVPVAVALVVAVAATVVNAVATTTVRATALKVKDMAPPAGTPLRLMAVVTSSLSLDMGLLLRAVRTASLQLSLKVTEANNS